MKLTIQKAHSSKNYFIVINTLDNNSGNSYLQGYSKKQLSVIVKIIESNRDFEHDELHHDGVLFIMPAPSCRTDAEMIFFNRDGKEAEMCGNGLRVIGKILFDLSGEKTFLIKTKHTTCRVEITEAMFSGITTVAIYMDAIFYTADKVGFHPKNKTHATEPKKNKKLVYLEGQKITDKGCLKERVFYFLSLTNPHLVCFDYQETIIDNDSLYELAAAIATNEEYFPKHINLNVVKVISEDTIFVKTYERGVGITNACGTGMCAATIVGCCLGKIKANQWVTVQNEGGMVQTFFGNDFVIQKGNATSNYHATLTIDPTNSKVVHFKKTCSASCSCHHEALNYDEFIKTLTWLNRV